MCVCGTAEVALDGIITLQGRSGQVRAWSQRAVPEGNASAASGKPLTRHSPATADPTTDAQTLPEWQNVSP